MFVQMTKPLSKDRLKMSDILEILDELPQINFASLGLRNEFIERTNKI